MVTRRGGRRTSAEPLTASWRVDTAEYRQRRPSRQPGRSPLSAYGWRIYAIPLLIILTVVVLLNTVKSSNNSASGNGSGPPVATERAAVPVFTGSGTAVLPDGPNVPPAGAGTWHVVPGSGAVVGKGAHLVRYQVAVEDGIDPSAYGGDDAFAQAVAATLADPRSWIAAGTVSLQRVDTADQKPDFVVSLTTPNTVHRPDLCGFDVHYEASCWRPGVHRVIINLARWVRGALAFDGDLGLYRQYAINDEVGEVFGNKEVGCATDGGLAPVMMPQTFGVADDYVHDLDQVDPVTKNRVPRDGRTCRVNAWPYPQGPGAPADNPPE